MLQVEVPIEYQRTTNNRGFRLFPVVSAFAAPPKSRSVDLIELMKGKTGVVGEGFHWRQSEFLKEEQAGRSLLAKAFLGRSHGNREHPVLSLSVTD